MTQNAETPSQQYLTFLSAGEEYAIRILAVREILTYGEITAVPKAAPWMRGVTNVRGSVVPVVDLAMKLGFEPTTPTSITRIVIVEASIGGETTTIGLIAAAVNQVIDLATSDIEPPPTLGTQIDSSYLVGVGRTGGSKFVLVLDIDAVLTRSEAVHVAEAANEPAASEEPLTAEPGIEPEPVRGASPPADGASAAGVA